MNSSNSEEIKKLERWIRFRNIYIDKLLERNAPGDEEIIKEFKLQNRNDAIMISVLEDDNGELFSYSHLDIPDQTTLLKRIKDIQQRAECTP